jgi:hypothetical protein
LQKGLKNKKDGHVTSAPWSTTPSSGSIFWNLSKKGLLVKIFRKEG